MALSTLTQTLDDAFTTTWYRIKPKATDNILEANVVTAALREKGAFTTQVGESRIERTIRYGTKTAQNVQKGDVLNMGEDKIETAALWDWKYTSVHIQRSLQDDQKNSGSIGKIKSLVQMKINAAKDALNDKIESSLLAIPDANGGTDLRADRDINSIRNMMPGSTEHGAAGNYHDSASYNFGGIAFDNSWWRASYKTKNNPANINLLDDMKNLFNTCGGNRSYPNLILTTQTLFETYESFALDNSQIIKGASRLADLGYDVLKFKGQDMVWSGSMTTGMVYMLNTRFIEIVYDPNLWFEMTQWKYIPNQLERIAHIIMAWQLIGTQPRRQGLLGTYS